MTLALASAAASIAAVPAVAADAPTGGDKRVRAFVLSTLYMVGAGEAGSCPAMAESSLDLFASTLPPEERAKYANTAENQGLVRLMYERLGFQRVGIGVKRDRQAKLPPGFDPSLPMTLERAREIGAYNGFPKGKGRPAWSGMEVVYTSCSDPQDFPQLDKGHQLYDGKVAAGMDLDGKVGRDDFVGRDGATGIDNQVWRVMGCIKAFRDESLPENARAAVLSAGAPTIIEISDLDDIGNDPDVTVHIHAAAEPLSRNGTGGVLSGVTFTPQRDPRLTTSVHGRIVDGVLLTDPVDLRLRFKEQAVLDTVREFRGARIRAVFKPDGSIEGSLNGYYTLASLWEYIEQRTQESSVAGSYSCPAVYKALNRHADGYRDPKTGRYTAISSSYNFLGVRAFVTQPSQIAANEVTQ
jgi:hypothetical protein